MDVSGRAGKGWQPRPTRGWHRTRTQTRKNAGNGRPGEQLSMGAGETLGSSLALQKKKKNVNNSVQSFILLWTELRSSCGSDHRADGKIYALTN